MNESDNTRAINQRVKDAGVYALKIQTLMNNAVPDCWYSGFKHDLWVEMKYISEARMPQKDSTPIKSMLSDLQSKWLNDRYNEGRNVAVIISSKQGCVAQINPLMWNTPITKKELIMTRTQVIKWIIGKTNG